VYRASTTTVAGRRRFLQWGYLALAAPFVPACGIREPTRIGVQSWAGFQFLTLAQRRGWYRDHALELVSFESADETTAALQTRQLQAATVTLDEAIRLRAENAPIQVALVCDVSTGADVVLARPGIASLAGLRGRRVGVESTALGALMHAEMLRVAGLRAGDVVAVPIGEDHYRDWQRGDLDAVLTYGLSAELLEADGLTRLADSRHLRQVIYDVLVVRSDLDAGERRELRALIGGHFRALDLWHQKPIDASYELAPLLQTTPDRVRHAFEGLDLPDATNNRRWLEPPATGLLAAARHVSEVLVRADLLERAPELDDFFTTAYLPTRERMKHAPARDAVSQR